MTRIFSTYPEGLTRDARDRLKYYIDLIPSWVDQIHVKYDPEDVDSILKVEVGFARREVKFYVCDAFGLLLDEQRDEAVLHEISHFYYGPLSDVIDAIKNIVIDDSTIVKIIEDQVERAEEFLVVDLIGLLRTATVEDEDAD